MNTSPNSSKLPNAELVGIVGMGCRWPGGVNSPQQMWSFLKEERSGFRPFDSTSLPRCFSATGFHHPNPARPGTTAAEGGFLVDGDPRLFDHAFFGITGREAETLDPSQRKLLEVVYEAFENAGETWASVAGSNTGVFVGNFALDHWVIQARDWDYPKPHSTTGASPSILANRISHVFDLRGPSFTLDTACSSSMYAVHLAVSAIRNGDCDSAIVAASNWIADPSLQIAVDKLGALSPTSRCHTFDASADGYARGEGFAALYLKRLPAALASGSPIRAVIRGTAVNANGQAGGITRPSAVGQEAVIRKAYANAGLPFFDTTYFECHGTGTPVGDPIELAAVRQVFASNRIPGHDNSRPLFVGSVKTNMGHAEGASALAAIMKVVLSLEAGEIPPSIGVNMLNPNINFSGVEVVRQVTAWPKDRLRRASINCFGFGGANGHAIIESYHAQLHPDHKVNSPMFNGYVTSPHNDEITNHGDDLLDNNRISNGDEAREEEIHRPIVNAPRTVKVTDATTRQFVLLPFSAHNEVSLQLNADAISQVMTQYSLADIAYTLSAKRSNLPCRSYRIIDRDNPQLSLLDINRKPGSHIAPTHQQDHDLINVAFVFTGQGAQWHGMCTQLFEYRVFRTAIEHLDNILRSLSTPPSTWSITDILKCNCDPDLIQTPAVSQTVCTAIQIGLVDLLASWSVCPIAVVGHSSGEIAAAYASGRATAAESIVIAYLRGRAVENSRGDGAMLAVGLGSDQLQELGYLENEGVEKSRMRIAAINSPGSVTVSGDALAVKALAARLAADGVFHRLLKTGGMAYHSHHMIGPGEEYEESLSNGLLNLEQTGSIDERQKYPRVLWVSSVTPDVDPPSSMAGSSTYWRANLESPVRFSDAVVNLVQRVKDYAPDSRHNQALIEIGPHSALKGPLEQILKVGLNEIIYAGATLKRNGDARQSMLQLCGTLYCMNAKVDLVAVNAVDSDDGRLYNERLNDKCTLVHGCIAIDLPPYQYTYGPINYYECRSSKEYRLRKFPRHVLLGSKVPGVAKLRPQWRNVLHAKDLPWLRDHQLLPDVVFPAAGYIAMAIEAALRTHEESLELHLKPKGYIIRDLSIKTALRLLEDDHGVETIFSMELADVAPTGLSPWASFSISSVERSHVDSVDGRWTEHCTGMIKIEFGTLHDNIEKIDTASMNAHAIDAGSWYKAFTKIGLGYGPTFQTLTDIRADRGAKLASARVALNTAAGIVQGGESRYALHPAALDGTFQLGLIACYGGKVEAATNAFVPVHFSQISIHDSIHHEECDTATVVALGELRGLRGAYINQLQMLGPGGDVVLNIEKLRCISYVGEMQVSNETSGSAFKAPFARIVWKPDFHTLNYRSSRALFSPPKENIECLHDIEKLNRLACAILADIQATFVKSTIKAASIPSASGDVGYFFAWINRCVEETKIPEMTNARQLDPQERREKIRQLYCEIEGLVEARIAKHLYENMADILSERRTGVEVMIHGDDGINLLSALYQHGLFMTSAYRQLSRVIDGLSHKNPRLRILEVGAGTGGTTRVALKVLTGPNNIKRYREYAFTDISPGFLAAAQSSMSEYRDISYSVLDIETDPAAQGYQPVYDIVLASQVLHATKNMVQTLINCRKLLKPQGKLVLVENTMEDSVIIGLMLGTLTGYWHGIPDGRVNSPFMNLETWDRVLKEAGFSGAELVLDDYPRPNSVISTLVSTLVENDAARRNHNPSNPLEGALIHLLHSHELDPPLLCQLQQELERRGMTPRAAQLDEALSAVLPGARIVLFLDGEKDFLIDSEGYYLSTFQHLARTARTMVCLTSCGILKGRNPEGALIPGLLRTIRTENPVGRFISIDISIENSGAFTDRSEDLVRCVIDQLFPQGGEPEHSEEESQSPDDEFFWQDNCLWVSRVLPDVTFQPFTEMSPSMIRERAEDLSMQPLDAQGPIRAAFSTPGVLSSLYFRPYTELLVPMASDCIEVKVTAVGVNWKDLAVSSGRFDADNFSSEYAGVVTAVGADAADLFSKGQRVYGVGRGHFGNYTRVPAAFAQKLNDHDDLVEVATMPLVYMTALYAFEYLAHLKRGHRVLIQSATGGLGLAAIQLARTKGAEVFAMVGTREKAEFLIQELKFSESHVIAVLSGDSASALDRKLVRMTPRSRGFDVILSTARGDVLDASIRALALLGHFVHVGGTDMQDSKALTSFSFSKCANFSSFDMSLVLDADPVLGRELMETVHRYYREGLIGPVRPFSATNVAKLDQVLLGFSKGTHIGKLVVTFQDPKALVRMPLAPSSQPVVRFHPEACYIVVGGLGGLGRSIVRWMCERGARNLVILSRRGIKASSSAVQSFVRNLTQRGINIQPLACDISDLAQVTYAIQNMSLDFPNAPLKGIIHSAVSYLDLSFDKLTVSRWRDSLAAKVQGTRNLHEATLSLQTPLDFFVMITSLESIYSLATQSAYTAANVFQDAFARYRRRLGLPATSVSFGFVKGVGELGQDSITVDMFARNRTLTLSEGEFLARLEPAFLNTDDGVRSTGSNDDTWTGRAFDPLSTSNILTCLDPSAMAAKEHEEGETGGAGTVRSSISAFPHWFRDPRVSLVMQAFEDARRDQRAKSSSAVAPGGDDSNGKASICRIRREFDAATAAGTPEQQSEILSSVTNAISTAVAELLFVDASNVDPARTVADHGVDSLIAAELRNWFHQALGINIDMQRLLDTKTSIAALAGGIVDAAVAKGQGARGKGEREKGRKGEREKGERDDRR
ncbi:hypothetical protein F5Y09DRAFT_316941 [Xylaria sp. FL1042]|nr:hypothetical protein F5Y09DRAFT_316941 [Xylaria sp. FL1042]